MFIEIALAAIALLGVLSSIRIILGPSIWDRMLAFNLLSSKIIMLIVLFAFHIQQSYMLDMAIVYALLGFIGIIMIAKIVQQKRNI